MSASVDIRYEAPPTLAEFMDSGAFVRVVVGPVGSGKSSGCIIEILRRALEQAPGPDGIRRTRFAVIRNTYRELRDTTRKTFEQWIPDVLGTWREQDFTFRMEFRDVQCEVLFRALDRPEDVKKLLSLELTGAYVNEIREIPKHVFDVLQSRVGRYPSKAQGGPSWFGVWADTNPWHSSHWGAKLFQKPLPGFAMFRQPGGRSPDAENVENLPGGYYERLVAGKDSEWVKVYVDGQDAAGDVGSIYAAWLEKLERQGAIVEFEHPADGVFTSWDLGSSDSTAIWFWRLNKYGVADVIDYYEAHGEGLAHYFGVIEAKGYTYVRHWLPHDAKAKTLASQVSVIDQVMRRYPGKAAITPALSLEDGIAAARWLMEQPVRFHARCDKPGTLGYSGLEALREYRFEWDEEDRCFSRNPLHNWASHGADAFRYLALVVKLSELSRPKPKTDEPAITSVTFDLLRQRNKPRSQRI